jgi:methylenetetrahydrofolate reductase (NADPH)
MFSLEVTHKTDIAHIADLSPQLRDISITFLPRADYSAVVEQAKLLRLNGFNPIPHIAARSLKNRAELADFVDCELKLRYGKCL